MTPEQLAELGLGGRPGALYLALLAHGRGTAAELARAAGLKRTTAYDLLAELAAQKLASVTFAGKRRVFAAEPPENLQRRIERQSHALDRLLPDLNDLFYRHGIRPRVRYYEGAEGIRYVHEELLKVKAREYFYFGSMLGFQKALGQEYLLDFIRRRIRRKIWSNALRIRTEEIDDPLAAAGDTNYRRVRYLAKPPADTVANLTLYDDKIAVCSSAQENYGLIIESREMHTILKLIWDCLWAVAEE
ncbi:MAG: helix-turn-helix domain-containing protein [Lentisphaeria bacterium]